MISGAFYMLGRAIGLGLCLFREAFTHVMNGVNDAIWEWENIE